MASPTARAQIIADPAAPANQRPTVLMEANGRPTVNIQTPSAAGVSRNTYSQFDVQSNGVVLNNSRNSNPWLAAAEAKVILNEVNSSNPSYLGGTIILGGAKADVIIANPSGIKVDGATFFDTYRAILTTGTPILTNGALTGITISKGNVDITAKGFRGATYTEILSRAATVAGRVDAMDIRIVTGPQTIDYATGQLSPATATGTKPTLAIDTAALSGMYAGKITLLATEAGVGVRNAGTIFAGIPGHIIITADGRLENTGTIQAKVTSLATVSGNIDNSGTLQGRDLLMVSSGGGFTHRGTGMVQSAEAASTVLVHAVSNVSIAAGGQLLSEGTSTVNDVVTRGTININAGQNLVLGTGSKIRASGSVQLIGDGQLISFGSSIQSVADNVTIMAAQGMSVLGNTITGNRVHMETGAPFTTTSGNVSLAGGTIKGLQQTTVIATGDILVNSPGLASVSSGGNVYLQATGNLRMTAGSSTSAGGHFTAVADGALELTGKINPISISAIRDVNLSGGSVRMEGSSVVAGGELNVHATKSALVLRPLLDAQDAFLKTVGFQSGGDRLTLSAYQGDIDALSMVASGRNVHVVSNGATRVSNTTINASQDLALGSVHASGSVWADAVTLTAANRATISGKGAVQIQGAVAKPAAITASSISIEGGSLQMQAVTSRADAGHLGLAASTGSLTASATDMQATGNIGIHGTTDVRLDNSIASAGGNFGVSSAGTLGVHGGTYSAKDLLSFSSKGSQYQRGSFDGGAMSLYSQGGTLGMAGAHLQTRGTTTAALASVSGQLSIESGGGMTADFGTKFLAQSDLSIVTGSGNITITPPGGFNSAADLALTQGQFTAGRNMTVIAREGDLTLTGADGTNGIASVKKVKLEVPGELLLAGRNVTLQGSRVSGYKKLSVIATTGNLLVNSNRYSALEGNYTNTYWDAAGLIGGLSRSSVYGVTFSLDGEADIRAAGNIDINGAWIAGHQRTNIQSGGNITVSGLYNRWTSDANGAYHQRDYVSPSHIGYMGNLNIAALGGHLTLNAATVGNSYGDVRLQALGDITLEGAQDHEVYLNTTTQINRSWYGKKKVITTNVHNESLVTSPVWIHGASIELKAGNNVNTYASQFYSQGNLLIQAGDATSYYGVYDQINNQTTTNRTSSLWGIKYNRSTDTNTRMALIGRPAVLQSQGSIQSDSGGDQLLQGTIASAPYGTITFNTPVGDKARADARIKLEGLVNTVAVSRTRESNYVVWQKQVGSGSTVETLVLPKFTSPTPPIFNGPVVAQLPAGDFKTQIQTLSLQPGMTYVADFTQRTDVNWQPVKLAYDQWSYKQEGLTGAGAALLAIAVAVATSGAGAGLLGATGPVTSVAANAAFTSLASQAAITFVNNKGDLGRTFKDLGKSDIVKTTLAAALTAGVLDKIGGLPGISDLKGSAAFTDKLSFNLINAGGRALTNAAINGGSLEDAFKGAVLGAVVDTAHGAVASEIKLLETNYLVHKFAHALAGCVAGAAAQGTCRDGAIGAATGEMMADLFKGQKPGAYATEAEWTTFDNKVLGYSKIVAGAVSAYSGGNAQTAITTAETAVRNNFLTFDENQLRKQATQGCKGGNPQACADEKRWDQIDTTRDAKVMQVCSNAPASKECNDWRSFALLARDSYGGLSSGREKVLDFAAFKNRSDAVELQSIQKLIHATPYGYLANSPQLKGLLNIVADLTPIVGDVKAFQDATDPFDYAVAMIGTLGPAGDAASTAVRAAKAAHKAGNATEAAAQLQKAEKLIEANVGGKGSWSMGINGGLEPHATYKLTNGHVYKTDTAGRVNQVEGNLALTLMERNKYQQCVTGKCGELGDQGGHLIAATLGGAGDRINLVPQAATLNNGPWKVMENELKAALTAGKQVNIKIEVGYPSGDNMRPNVFRVISSIDGVIQPPRIFNQ